MHQVFLQLSNMQTSEISERKGMQQTYQHINIKYPHPRAKTSLQWQNQAKQAHAGHTGIATSYPPATLMFASHPFGSWGRTGEFQRCAVRRA